ncbi:HAD-IC family P-type ATPase [Haloglycomyces albus]|uniref:HAD-IC family P-type ATPase n=1 Tax=Haloglycomyces albus TaxID=526067 RepID=UPI00046D1359|nr:HAD-IC family P-type ATPase [Haloglycomyces albus]
MTTPVLDSHTGLTPDEVSERQSSGLVNHVKRRTSRPLSAILRGNFFTLFNTVIGVLAVIAITFGGFKQGLFGLVIVFNAGIGTFQELRAKRTLDKLSLVNLAKTTVIRGGEKVDIDPAELVQDDLIQLSPGDRIPVDGPVVESSNLEVDESLLTGEADPVAKEPDDEVKSGSFVVAGSGVFRAERVGEDSYAARLIEEASQFTLAHSDLRDGINRFIKVVTWLIIPIGLLLIVGQLLVSGSRISESILSTVAGIVPMIPEGLVLLTSIAFAVGVIRLGQRKCLVQELPAIEGLARTSVLCLDKTGTLTEGGMDVEKIRPVGEGSDVDVETALAALSHSDDSPNPTMTAVAEYLESNDVPDPAWRVIDTMPFSSARKWSGVRFTDHGNWLLGAPDVLLSRDDDAALDADMLSAQGLRVLVLATADSASTTGGVEGVRARALVILKQRLRSTAEETLAYFADQDVDVKIISGDSPAAVGAVASQLGVDSAGQTVDARTLPDDDERALADALEENTIFGRVNPHQKRSFVRALQSRGHTVAMTGDGVNDVLALKDADLGIAMGSGSPAARSVAQIVLLDDEFATMPHVVAEGRRVLGNIERVSNLFLTKTIYSICLALFVAVGAVLAWGTDNDPLPYPFLPIHVTLIGSLTIGIPAFFLALAPTFDRARPGFVQRVLKFAIPAGIACSLATFVAYVTVRWHGADELAGQTTSAIVLFTVALTALAIVSRPYRLWKFGLVAACGGAFSLALFTPVGSWLFDLSLPGVFNTIVAAVAAGAGVAALVLWLVIRPKHLR